MLKVADRINTKEKRYFIYRNVVFPHSIFRANGRLKLVAAYSHLYIQYICYITLEHKCRIEKDKIYIFIYSVNGIEMHVWINALECHLNHFNVPRSSNKLKQVCFNMSFAFRSTVPCVCNGFLLSPRLVCGNVDYLEKNNREFSRYNLL